jgi:hypothetical protein
MTFSYLNISKGAFLRVIAVKLPVTQQIPHKPSRGVIAAAHSSGVVSAARSTRAPLERDAASATYYSAGFFLSCITPIRANIKAQNHCMARTVELSEMVLPIAPITNKIAIRKYITP